MLLSAGVERLGFQAQCAARKRSISMRDIAHMIVGGAGNSSGWPNWGGTTEGSGSGSSLAVGKIRAERMHPILDPRRNSDPNTAFRVTKNKVHLTDRLAVDAVGKHL